MRHDQNTYRKNGQGMDLWQFIQKKIELLSINRGILYESYFTKMKTKINGEYLERCR